MKPPYRGRTPEWLLLAIGVALVATIAVWAARGACAQELPFNPIREANTTCYEYGFWPYGVPEQDRTLMEIARAECVERQMKQRNPLKRFLDWLRTPEEPAQ